MLRFRTSTALALAAALVAALLSGPPASAAPEHTKVTSRAADGLEIAISIYKPADASADQPAPVILHSHGWGGSRSSGDTAFGSWLDAGFGVVSIDQRGHGETGDIAHVQNPDLEAQDIMAVIDHIATLDWVALDGPGDPVLGAIGGSYGGGYQLITALTEVRETGTTRFNALAPQITWNDLPRSLAPNDVPRTLWTTLLYAAGASRLPDYVHQSQVLGTATGTFPNGEIPGTYNLKERFFANSPAWFAANGFQLDIPVLFGQGTSDNLFPLNEAYHNFNDVLTSEAQAQSLFVGYNGGHVLPSVLPAGTVSGGDACSGGFEALTRNFFTAAFAGADTSGLLGDTRFAITTAGGQCLRVEGFDPNTTVDLGVVATPTALGAPITFPIAEGPITLAGVPTLTGQLTSVGVDTRAFYALSVGTSAADAQILQNNSMPLRQLLPVVDQATTLELAGVAVEVPEGQTLFLTVSAVADMYAGMSRTPGLQLLNGAQVHLPVVG